MGAQTSAVQMLIRHNNNSKAVISVAPYLPNKGECTAHFKIKFFLIHENLKNDNYIVIICYFLTYHTSKKDGTLTHQFQYSSFMCVHANSN